MTNYIKNFILRINQNRRDFIWNWAISAVLFLLGASFYLTSELLETMPGMVYVLPALFCFLFSIFLAILMVVFLVIGAITLVEGGGFWLD